ncbi:quinolinate phosphoribosyl transferase [Candidatus Woesearchaeota archaeon]|nr:quinolinate phosphoribosyl transferase [Candidatus Woesearchaeota archaeon]
MSKQTLDEKVLKMDSRIKEGYYSDVYFNRTKEILEAEGKRPVLRMQVFQRNDDTCLCGIEEAVQILKQSLGEDYKKLKVKALHDGDIVNAWETVMTIEGDYSLFAHLETVYLGALARGTKVATNVYRSVKAANGKPVLFFPARFDSHLIQAKDGYSYKIGREAAGRENGGVSTDAQGEWWGSKGMGTIPHALIAAYNGQTYEAALAFAKNIDPDVKRVVLVDYDNDCVGTTLKTAEAMLLWYKQTKGDERFKLYGVRLDTSGNMVDKSVREQMDNHEYIGNFKPTGVNPQLVMNVYNALQEKAQSYPEDSIERKFYQDIGIVVSGGFNPERIKQFEDINLPVSAYGVGSSLLKGNFDFTADIVSRYVPATAIKEEHWIHNAKKGRKYNENSRLEEVL